MKKSYAAGNPAFAAFTILEILVGMAIAALVVVLGFYSLQMAQKQYNLFKNTTNTALDYRHLETLLWRDFTTANWVEKTNDTTLVCTGDLMEVRYRFAVQFVLRAVQTPETHFEDTLQVRVSIQETLLESKTVREGLTDQCIFVIYPFGNQYLYPVRKIYSAQERMLYKQKHEH